jgi:hypothetical protein
VEQRQRGRSASGVNMYAWTSNSYLSGCTKPKVQAEVVRYVKKGAGYADLMACCRNVRRILPRPVGGAGEPDMETCRGSSRSRPRLAWTGRDRHTEAQEISWWLVNSRNQTCVRYRRSVGAEARVVRHRMR